MAYISAFIIAKNEESRISKAIQSLDGLADEIIVIDSGSSDNTVKISESLGARVVFNNWEGYVKQKAFGESLCKHDWILNIDADEELSEDLRDEISYIFNSNIQNRYKAYAIDIKILHRSDEVIRSYAPCNTVIRLYNKNFASFSGITSTTHDAVRLFHGVKKSEIYKLNEPAYHRSGSSIEQLVAKANFYSSEQAKDLIASGRKISNLRIGSEFFFALAKAFFIRRYFIFGFDGFIDSMIFAFGRFMRLAKAREKEREDRKS
jgi:glycosyltransferase involved in cell wall biosynthesis